MIDPEMFSDVVDESPNEPIRLKVHFDPSNNNKIMGYYLPKEYDDQPEPPDDNWIELSEAEHQAAIDAKATNVVDGVCVFIEPTLSDEDAAHAVRVERDFLLKDSDFTQYPDVSMSDEKKAAWATYRQALRDISSQDGFPQNVVFPEKPA
jgi:hypothetical protein